MRFLLITLTFFGALLGSAQDQVILKNGDRFFGSVTALSDGRVEMLSPHSEAPLAIKSGELASLNFKEKDRSDLPTHAHQLNLRNGDVIPGKVTGLDAEVLKFETWFAGTLTVPRSQIKSVFYGITPQRLIYQGPNELKEWNENEEWAFQNGTLTSNSKSSAARDLDLPESFILRFQLQWQSSPTVRVHFCTTAESGPDNTDGYYLDFSNRGIALNRALPPAKEGEPHRIMTLGNSTKRSQDFANRQCSIELRVDRPSQRILFYLDDVFQGTFHDPHTAPQGGRVIFESISSVRHQISVSAIKLRAWDALTQRMRVEPRLDEKTDTLTTDDGDRYSGEILQRSSRGEASVISVKSPLLPDPIEIPESRSSILYFAEGSLPESKKGLFFLSLTTGGRLNLSRIQLGKTEVEGTHPWLGKLTLDRRIVSELSLFKEDRNGTRPEAAKK